MDQELFREAYHEYGEAICDGCNETVDLSTADDVDEAVKVWNRHVESEHRDASA